MPATLRHASTISTSLTKWPISCLGRTALSVILAAGLSMVLAPASSAAQPTRTAMTPSDYVIQAGFGCAFDVQVHFAADYRSTKFEFSDGRVMRIGVGDKTLTNLDTGATFAWTNDFQRTETYDPATNELLVDNSGRIALEYWPGDVDETGQVVGANGAFKGVIGHLEATLDLGVGSFTSASLHGQAIDLCAALSE
jgi:hypothetical protein